MINRAFYNSDGDFLVVPETGSMDIITEFGKLIVSPREIVVIPRGIKFAVSLVDQAIPLRGYVLEIFQGHFELPNLGPIGSNGLANPRDFQVPQAWYEDRDESHGDTCLFMVENKYLNEWFQTTLDHSCFDLVAWSGNYYPYKYDLSKFNTINTVSFDHPVRERDWH